MKRVYLTTIATVLALLLAFSFIHAFWNRSAEMGALKVGFVYEGDESTPYTYNFALAQAELEKTYPGKVTTLTRSNVLVSETEEPLRELVKRGCEIIFVNSASNQVAEVAREHPGVQFCQVSFFDPTGRDTPDNYHTFGGKSWQGFYVSGLAAGMKLRALIDDNILAPGDARLGFVASAPDARAISEFTAFLLGARSAAPEATLTVKYSGAWSSYSREKASAEALIEAGCAVIAQGTHTIGPAMACAEASDSRRIIHVGCNRSMLDNAPGVSLISTRVNWAPYVLGAVDAVLNGRSIEKSVEGTAHGTDLCAGFEQDWVQVLELNKQLAAYGTQEKLDRAIEGLKKGSIEVFKGPYTGVSATDPSDTCDLSAAYPENRDSSWPTFHYLLDGLVTVLEEPSRRKAQS